MMGHEISNSFPTMICYDFRMYYKPLSILTMYHRVGYCDLFMSWKLLDKTLDIRNHQEPIRSTVCKV